jgi:hypothetical protein
MRVPTRVLVAFALTIAVFGSAGALVSPTDLEGASSPLALDSTLVLAYGPIMEPSGTRIT